MSMRAKSNCPRTAGQGGRHSRARSPTTLAQARCRQSWWTKANPRHMGVSENRGTRLGGPFERILFHLGYKRGTPILGNTHSATRLLFRACAAGDIFSPRRFLETAPRMCSRLHVRQVPNEGSFLVGNEGMQGPISSLKGHRKGSDQEPGGWGTPEVL